MSAAAGEDWPAAFAARIGIADLDERAGSLVSQFGSAAEQRWLGRALRAMGARGREIAHEAQLKRGSEQRLAWLDATGAEMAPFAEPAGAWLGERSSWLEPACFGGGASVPLSLIAETIARAQIGAGATTPFLAYDVLSRVIRWEAL